MFATLSRIGNSWLGNPQSTAIPESQATVNGVNLTLAELLNFRLSIKASSARRRKRVSAPRVASQRSRALGRGLDFSEVRTYLPGDDVRLIDWNVTARTNVVHTKLFEEEKERPVFFAVDFTQSMRFGTRAALKSVAAARLAAQLAWLHAASGERIGGMVFSEHRHLELKPFAGNRGTMRLLRALVDLHRESLELNRRANESESALSAVFPRLRKIAHPGSTVVIVSDFHRLNDTDEKHLRWLCAHTECIAARVADVIEVNLPKRGVYAISDGRSNAQFDAAMQSIRTLHRRAHADVTGKLLTLFNSRGNYGVEFGGHSSTQEVARAVVRRTGDYAISNGAGVE